MHFIHISLDITILVEKISQTFLQQYCLVIYCQIWRLEFLTTPGISTYQTCSELSSNSNIAQIKLKLNNMTSYHIFWKKKNFCFVFLIRMFPTRNGAIKLCDRQTNGPTKSICLLSTHGERHNYNTDKYLLLRANVLHIWAEVFLLDLV